MKDLQLDHMWTTSADSIDRHVELSQVKEILARAQKCRALLDAEPGWNESVHCRVLKLALKGQTGIGYQNMYVLPFHFQRPPCDQPLYNL